MIRSQLGAAPCPVDSINSTFPDKASYRFAKTVEQIFDAVLGVVLLAELVVLFGNVALRAITGYSFAWGNEVATMALTVVAFVGGAVAYDRGQHMAVRALLTRLPAHWEEIVEAVGHWLVFGTAGVGLYLSYPILAAGWEDVTPVLELRKAWVFLPFAVGMLLLAVFALKRLLRQELRARIAAGALVASLGLLWFVAQSRTGPWNGPGGLAIAVAILCLTLAAGLPIGFVLPMVSYLYLFSARTATLEVVPIAMQNGISGFIMLAIPFFILAGNLMTEGGLAQPLADWVHSLVGHVRGGLMQVLVLSVFVFSGISGSKVADITAVGTSLRGMLRLQRYEPAESAAVLAGSAIMGETIPPSLPLLVLASVTTLSVGALFVAGVLPAVLMACCLMVLIYFRAQTKGWQTRQRTSWLERCKLTAWAFPALLVPVMLAVGIAGGIATPTEVSSFAVVYAIAISMLAYRGMGVRGLGKVLAHAGTASGMILFIISAGSAFSWTLTVANLPRYVIGFLHDLGGSTIFFQVATIVALVITGGLLEGLPALLIFGPMLLPIAAQFGIDPTQYGIVLIFSMGMGTFLPPVGIGFFVACSVVEATMEETAPRLVPYVLVLFVGLILVTFVPWFSLILPKTLHLLK